MCNETDSDCDEQQIRTTQYVLIAMLAFSYILIFILFAILSIKYIKKTKYFIASRQTSATKSVPYDEICLNTSHINPNYMSNNYNQPQPNRLRGSKAIVDPHETYCHLHQRHDECSIAIPQIILSFEDETDSKNINATTVSAPNTADEQDIYSLAAASNISSCEVHVNVQERNSKTVDGNSVHDYSSISNCNVECETHHCDTITATAVASDDDHHDENVKHEPAEYEEFYSITADACGDTISESSDEEEDGQHEAISNIEDQNKGSNDLFSEEHQLQAIYGNVGVHRNTMSSVSADESEQQPSLHVAQQLQQPSLQVAQQQPSLASTSASTSVSEIPPRRPIPKPRMLKNANKALSGIY